MTGSDKAYPIYHKVMISNLQWPICKNHSMHLQCHVDKQEKKFTFSLNWDGSGCWYCFGSLRNSEMPSIHDVEVSCSFIFLVRFIFTLFFLVKGSFLVLKPMKCIEDFLSISKLNGSLLWKGLIL